MTRSMRAFYALPESPQSFLKLLVQYGGACTSSDARKALGLTSRRGGQFALLRLLSNGFLSREYFPYITNSEAVYFPSPWLGRALGCERRTSLDPECVADRVFRFAMTQRCLKREVVNYVQGIESWPFSDDSLQIVRRAQRDEPIANQTVLVNLVPSWTYDRARNRIRWWLQVDPRVRVEVWTVNADYAQSVLAHLRPDEQSRVTQVVVHAQPFVSRFVEFDQLDDAKTTKQSRQTHDDE